MTDTVQYYRIFLPYVLIKCKDDRWTFVNRNYKPVGIMSEKWTDYDEFAVKIEGLTPKKIEALRGGNLIDDTNSIYMYNDSNSPWLSAKTRDAYFKRLDIL